MTHYIALVADICDSKKLSNRSEVQEKLSTACKKINEQAAGLGLVSPYTITLGDEVQALFRSAKGLWASIFALELAMHPVRLRFGIGVGEIVTQINRDAAIGMDGSAFHRAREAVEALREENKHYRVIGLEQNNELVGYSLDMISHLRDSWRPNRLATFKGSIEGRKASSLAEELAVSVQAIYRNIRDGELAAILGFLQELSKIINAQLDSKNLDSELQESTDDNRIQYFL